ncbi:putative D-2-hydroxyglutarate dehydrogenase, mitochondrial [Symbiodinium microadriaticum]|uniref:Putative D-2-hydroxyglutarate dehydrogenase, mitochondrial n=1 Tax=Symbiodinium microadriaticum TaxID=2951 RepID=A0A1Q9E7I1_SYMMI|nr:putative D-2-hydroxyglutarate dehydrogenase, mitochondrial [Symbiodinium microadriaticum]
MHAPGRGSAGRNGSKTDLQKWFWEDALTLMQSNGTQSGHYHPSALIKVAAKPDFALSRLTEWKQVLIETSGSDGDHDAAKLHRFLEAAMSGDGDAAVRDGVVAADETQARAIWRLREGVSDAMTTAGYVYKYDVSLPLPRMYELVEDTRARLRDAGVEESAKTAGYGHLGDANLHLNVTSLTGRDDKVLDLLEPWLFEWVAKASGSISAEHGIGQCKPHFLHLSKADSAVDLMKTLKATLDPQGILNPYKVLV